METKDFVLGYGAGKNSAVSEKIVEEVDAWLDEHITNPDSPPLDRSLTSSSAAAPADLVGDISDTVSDVRNTLNHMENGVNENMTAGNAMQLDSTVYAEDQVPYLFRQTGGGVNAGTREIDTIVGGTIAWNQLVQNGNFSTKSIWNAAGGTYNVNNNIAIFTCSGDNVGRQLFQYVLSYSAVGHKVFVNVDVNPSVSCTMFMRCGQYQNGRSPSKSCTANTWTNIQGIKNIANDDVSSSAQAVELNIYSPSGTVLSAGDTYQAKNAMCIDITAMFGSTIADRAYALEQATAGSGIAWLKSMGFFTQDYYAYDAGTLKSVEGLQSHDMTGFNQFDKSTANIGKHLGSTGNITDDANSGTSDYIRVLPNEAYYCANILGASAWYSSAVYDSEKNFIQILNVSGSSQSSGILTMPRNAAYLRVDFLLSAIDSVCVSISDPAKNGTYEPYVKHSYPLDSDLTLRGIPKLDANNKLYYDGDTYEADGSVTRLYGIRSYQSGDESLADAVTDGTNTVYKLATPTAETADPFQTPQICDKSGTEEYVTTGIVPAGHLTKYPVDQVKKLDNLPSDLSFVGPIENGATCQNANGYLQGQYFVKNNQFCKAKTAIASGATFTLNTNYEVTTVAAELYAAINS